MTILPASAIPMAPTSLVSLPLRGVRLTRTIAGVSRRSMPMSDLATDLLSRIESERIGRFRSHVKLCADPRARPQN